MDQVSSPTEASHAIASAYVGYAQTQNISVCVCVRACLCVFTRMTWTCRAVFSVTVRLQNGTTVQLAVAALYLEASAWNKD